MYVITVIGGTLDGRIFKIEKNKYYLERLVESIKYEEGTVEIIEK